MLEEADEEALVLSHRAMQRFAPGELADAGGLDRFTYLDLSHNALSLVSGIESFTRLVCLDLSHNGIATLDGAALPSGLERLLLAHNALTTLLVYPPTTRSGGISAFLSLPRLRELDVSFNRLEHLRGIAGDGSTALRVVRAEGNQLRSLAGLEGCPLLEELSAHRNMIKEAADLAALRALGRLRSLTLAGNPLVLRKRQVNAAHGLLPSGLLHCDLPDRATPSGSASASVNTSVQSATAASEAPTPAAAASGGRPTEPPAPLACLDRAVDTAAFQQMQAERDACRAECAALRSTVAALEEQLREQRESTAVLLRINEQLQKRMQKGEAGGGGGKGAPAAAAAGVARAKAALPLAPALGGTAAAAVKTPPVMPVAKAPDTPSALWHPSRQAAEEFMAALRRDGGEGRRARGAEGSSDISTLGSSRSSSAL